MITEDYVSRETAILLKEKGFNDANCFYSYMENGGTKVTHWENELNLYPKPTLQMACKWLREVHHKYIEICTDIDPNFTNITFRPAIYDKDLDCLWESDNYKTYEEATEAAIKYVLENLI